MPDSTITAVEAVPLRFPFPTPIASSLGSYTHVDFTAVWLHTEVGVTGFGFNAGLGGHAGAAIVPYIEAELAPLAVGKEALAPERLWHDLWSANKPRLRGGLGAWALSALDIACWDIVGKLAGLPLHALLGGHSREVPVYGSGGWLSLDDDQLLAECEEFVGQGIAAYKYKVGGPRDRERTELLRREMGDDLLLLADANQSLTVEQAVELSLMLAGHGVGWLEEPVLADSTDDLALVAARSEVPIAAGENVYYRWGFREICERGAAAYLQPDVARCGGITEFVRIGALADAYRLQLSSHLWHELSISLVGAFPSGYMAEYAPLLPADAFTRPFVVKDGGMVVPDSPGHGVELTAEARDHFAV